MNPVPKTDLFAALPAPWPEPLLPQIQQHLAAHRHKLVVLDDDPTGTQTVYATPVLTTWTVDALRAAFAEPSPVFYILTNSRSLNDADARTLNTEIGVNLRQAAAETPFTVVSRSDSTLRGHFPAEVSALAAALGEGFDAWLIIPFFEEGGRFTINDVHYVAEGDTLIPAHETPFAQDAAFGYTTAHMPAWVDEKTRGAVRAADVRTISLATLREGGPDAVYAQLMALDNGAMCVVNAASYRDVEVFVLALLRAEAAGKRFLYRTAASFVRVRAGLAARSLLSGDDLRRETGTGGLVVVGSYVPKSTDQLQHLLATDAVTPVELSVPALLDATRDAEIARATAALNDGLHAGRTTVLYTSRELVSGDDAHSSLGIGGRVSSGVIAVLRGMAANPRFVVAKGGITSSDVATQALNVSRALVRGQIAPGVPVWELDATSRFPGMPYVVFPGNVGTVETLTRVVETLSQQQLRPAR